MVYRPIALVRWTHELPHINGDVSSSREAHFSRPSMDLGSDYSFQLIALPIVITGMHVLLMLLIISHMLCVVLCAIPVVLFTFWCLKSVCFPRGIFCCRRNNNNSVISPLLMQKQVVLVTTVSFVLSVVSVQFLWLGDTYLQIGYNAMRADLSTLEYAFNSLKDKGTSAMQAARQIQTYFNALILSRTTTPSCLDTLATLTSYTTSLRSTLNAYDRDTSSSQSSVRELSYLLAKADEYRLAGITILYMFGMLILGAFLVGFFKKSKRLILSAIAFATIYIFGCIIACGFLLALLVTLLLLYLTYSPLYGACNHCH